MKKTSILTRLSFAVAPALALMVCSVTPQAQGQASPEGDWDFYFAGAQKGVAQISFDSDNFTLAGIEILMPGKPSLSGAVDLRGNSDTGRDPRTGDPIINTNTTFYGGADIHGFWGFDTKGRVVGVMTLTNLTHTNGLSFTAKVVPGTRMTISAVASSGHSVYRGVPRVILPDFAGDYFATGKRGKSTYVEIDTLTSTIFPNFYTVDSHGPGFDGQGFAVFSANKHVAVYYDYFRPGSTNAADLIIVATSGTYKTNKLPVVSGTISGTDGTNNISLKIGRLSAPSSASQAH